MVEITVTDTREKAVNAIEGARVERETCPLFANFAENLCFGPIRPKMAEHFRRVAWARAEPVAVAKHGRPVVVVMAMEEYDRLMFF